MNRLVLALLLIFALRCHANDWPEWRGGPKRDGIWNDPTLSTTPTKEPTVIWKAQIGTGYSSPSVIGKRLFVMDRTEPKTDQEQERVLCLDRETGSNLWTYSYSNKLKLKSGYENGPRTTPTVHGDKVYTLGAMGRLNCLELETGREIWKKELVADFGGRIPTWGYANAPWVEGKSLFVQAGATNGTVIALDKDSGKELWKFGTNNAGYSAILEIQSGGKKQLIVWSAESIHSLDPVTGSPFWSLPRRLRWDQAVATPVWNPAESLLGFSADREGTLVLKLSDDKPGYRIAWDSFALSSLHSSIVQVGGVLYGINHNGDIAAECGELRSVQMSDGKLNWVEKTVAPLKMHTQGSTAYNEGNGLFYITTETGELVIARASAEKYQQLAKFQIGGKTWSHPAYANHCIYFRSENTLVCSRLE
ncbi:MAG: pvaA 1 [Verrucomicrobiales bacterium]|jgi:outer membrane protein assembly factor BamB|nr:pvaA 1 [Verrucomicrobiales bacterium]